MKNNTTAKPATITPAPWRISAVGKTNDGGQIIVADGKTEANPDTHSQICVVALRADDAPKRNAYLHPCAERDANARLIVCAPDLLECAHDAADCLDALAGDMPPAKAQATRSIVARIRATITKATVE